MKSNTQTVRSLPMIISLGPLALVLSLVLPRGMSAAEATDPSPTTRWFNARELHLEGKGWADTKHFYDRLPAHAEGRVRAPVWALSHDTAGMCVWFVTDASALHARWTVRKETLALPHMPASGVSGLDLYARHKNGWRWLGGARPDKSVTTEKALATGLRAERRECVLYLPLYNGIEKLEIGVSPESRLEAVPARASKLKPVVFYGTSIVQGGCAARPGMAYPAILGRRLEVPTINLGFSGNARGEPEMASLLAELAPSVYVLDPLPNLRPDWVEERMPKFLATLRAAHPRVPIVLVEHLEMSNTPFAAARHASHTESNAALRKLYDRCLKAGDRRLFYVRGDRLLGEDGEGTVDGVHPTDLGFVRMADALEPVLKRALRVAR